jgi:hypothetical protein
MPNDTICRMCLEDDVKPGTDLCLFCEGTLWYYQTLPPDDRKESGATMAWDFFGFALCVACGLCVIAAVARLF